MIRRQSLNRKKSRKFKRRRSRRSRQFGNNDFLSNFIKPRKIKELLILVNNISGKTLQNIKSDLSPKLIGCKQKFQRFIINSYRLTINDIISNLNAAQIVQLMRGKYTNELRNRFLIGTKLPNVDDSQIPELENKFGLVFLRSIFGKTILHNIKIFIKSLTNEQLVLLINGKYNLQNALVNAFIGTSYPTSKDVKKIKKIDDIIKEND
jgi:hypothetical protein